MSFCIAFVSLRWIIAMQFPGSRALQYLQKSTEWCILLLPRITFSWSIVLQYLPMSTQNIEWCILLSSTVTTTPRQTRPNGWISIHAVGNPSSVDGIPTTGWKSIQWMDIPPGVGWISNHLSQNGWMEIQPSMSQSQAWNCRKFCDPTKIICKTHLCFFSGIPEWLTPILPILRSGPRALRGGTWPHIYYYKALETNFERWYRQCGTTTTTY